MKHLLLKSCCVGALCATLSLTGCDSPQEKNFRFASASSEKMVLHHGETRPVELQGVPEGILPEWSVQNQEIATIDAQGLVTAGLVGSTEFFVKIPSEQPLQGSVVVEPRYQSYIEPLYTGEKVTREMIEKYETRTLEKTQPFTENSILIRYKGEKEEIKRVVYIYNEKENFVEQAYVELANKEVYTKLRCYDFLEERYKIFDTDPKEKAPDGQPATRFRRNNIQVKPMSLFNNTTFAIFYQDPNKE